MIDLFAGFQQDEPYMKPGLADQKNAIVVPHIASASKVKGAPEKYELMEYHSFNFTTYLERNQ